MLRCSFCNYITDRKFNLQRHNNNKHYEMLEKQQLSENVQNVTPNVQNVTSNLQNVTCILQKFNQNNIQKRYSNHLV